MRDLLFEIGTEEIPAGFLQPALSQLKDNFSRKAKELNIDFGRVKTTGTPRRITLLVNDLAEKQNDIKEELLGPSEKAGVGPDGKFTRAAVGFANSKGADVADLQVTETPKGKYLLLVRDVQGRNTVEILPELLFDLIGEFNFPKSMRWGSNHKSFARPIQWLTALFGKETVPFAFEGIESANVSRGHRFMANEPFGVSSPESYEKQLEEKSVIVDGAKRRELVIEEIKRAVKESDSLADGQVFIDENLVDTVTNLVEIPYGVCGEYDKKFLQLPAEVLITSMREHQKYFPVIARDGSLLPGFVAVNNTRVNNPDVTRKGHQRVLRARLEDALFFYNSDREVSLESRLPRLRGIIFQAKLGTMLEKNDRLVKLARILAEKIDPSLVDDCCRAAKLCKVDLLSDMVGEFPTLQGIMGGAYARHDGEKEEVAAAIKEHYMPYRAGEATPPSDTGGILALADRFDTLVGCFGIGQTPTGTTDPFGLRRISLAILHIIEAKGWVLSLREIVQKALALYGKKVDGSTKTVDMVIDFIKGRFANDCISRGLHNGSVAAAVSVDFDNVIDCLLRIDAIEKIRQDEAFQILAASYKRIRNIIKDNESTAVSVDLFEDDAESRLYELYSAVSEEMQQLVDNSEYVAALQVMLKMKEPVDRFFDEVMVMAENEEVRQNRLNLLTSIGDLILQIGDISKIN